jgi:hypothetical protein
MVSLMVQLAVTNMETFGWRHNLLKKIKTLHHERLKAIATQYIHGGL